MTVFLRLAAVFGLLLTCSGCQTVANWFKGGQKEDVVSDYGELAVYRPDGEPRITPGLALKISVSASGADVSETVKEVSVSGDILLPLVGKVACDGLTLLELQDRIKKAFEEYYRDPQVQVSFAYAEGSSMKSPWGTVLLQGAIARPGPVNMPSTLDLTVTRALMLAGNPTNLADKRKVRVTRRQADGSLKRFDVDIVKIGKEGRADLDLALKPGDVVWVPYSWY
ncbi:MAG: polysaccharide biosynthesis/export family protein [Kiritimatiellae bacterium]|nr:polysaccharide biosynthesis/export family protein [Kiritimatiellia bacterium]